MEPTLLPTVLLLLLLPLLFATAGTSVSDAGCCCAVMDAEDADGSHSCAAHKMPLWKFQILKLQSALLQTEDCKYQGCDRTSTALMSFSHVVCMLQNMSSTLIAHSFMITCRLPFMLLPAMLLPPFGEPVPKDGHNSAARASWVHRVSTSSAQQ